MSREQRILQAKGEIERREMQERATQIVKIVFHNKLWGVPNQFYGVALEFKNPLSIQEIRERIHDAFPELETVWEEGNPGAP